MAGWHRPHFQQSREALLEAIDSACVSIETSSEGREAMGGVEVPILLQQFRRQCAEALPELVANSSVAFENLKAPLSTLETHFCGCVLDPELFSRISFSVRAHILAVFFRDRLESCREQLVAYFEDHKPPAKGWTVSSMQRFEGFGSTSYTLYSLLRKVLPQGEREALFEEFVLAHLPSTPLVERWRSAYHRPKPKRRCSYDWDALSSQQIANILVSLLKPRVDPATHRWGLDSLGDWVDEDGVNVGASVVYYFLKNDPGQKRAQPSARAAQPCRSERFEREVLPFLPRELADNYAPKPYKKTRWINPKPDEDDATAFRDVLAAQSDRFVRWEALHSLFACEGNPHAFEYLKMDITDYLFEQFSGISDDIFYAIERCLHLYEKSYKGPRSRSSAAGLRNYVVSTVSRRQVKFWGSIQRPYAARVIPSRRHRLLKMEDLIRPVRMGRDLFQKYRSYPLQGYPIEVWARLLEWERQQQEAGFSDEAIRDAFLELYDIMENELHPLEADGELFVAEEYGVEIPKVVGVGEDDFEGGLPRLAANGE